MLLSLVCFYVRDADSRGETSYFMSKLPFFRNLENLSPRKIQLGETKFYFANQLITVFQREIKLREKLQ